MLLWKKSLPWCCTIHLNCIYEYTRWYVIVCVAPLPGQEIPLTSSLVYRRRKSGTIPWCFYFYFYCCLYILFVWIDSRLLIYVNITEVTVSPANHNVVVEYLHESWYVFMITTHNHYLIIIELCIELLVFKVILTNQE